MHVPQSVPLYAVADGIDAVLLVVGWSSVPHVVKLNSDASRTKSFVLEIGTSVRFFDSREAAYKHYLSL